MPRQHHIANAVARWLGSRLGGDRGSAILLIAAAAAAMVLANSPLAGSYHGWFHAKLAWTPVPKLDTWHLWINDAAMAVFFFVVGLEIKREVLDGELSRADRRRLPVLAAIMGMIAPALVYIGITAGEPALHRGWAIPTATDIAFAVGVLALVGKGLPPSLRLFLLTVAIVDDLGATLVIAFFYTATIKLAWLGASAAAIGVLVALNRLGLARVRWYILPIAALWYCVLHSGVHPTIAGVLAALTIPMAVDRRHHDSLLLRLEHALVPWNAYLIVPLFGFANAGVALAGLGIKDLVAPLPVGIAAGLFVGKQIGIFAAIALAARFGLARPPAGASWAQLWGVATLCGIGFTMSLFVGALAFGADPLLYEEAKLGVLAGTLLSALAGAAILRFAPPRPSPG